MNNMDVLTCVVFKNLFVKDKKSQPNILNFIFTTKLIPNQKTAVTVNNRIKCDINFTAIVILACMILVILVFGFCGKFLPISLPSSRSGIGNRLGNVTWKKT